MAFLLGPMRLHIFGNKQLTKELETKYVEAGNEVCIPLCAAHTTTFDVLVNEGDHVYVGTKLAQCSGNRYVPIYASVSGIVKGIKKLMHSSLKPVDHIVIENDGKMEEKQAFQPLNYQEATKEELIAFMKEAGIIGQGGAGFPAYIKYDHNQPIEKVIINGVECEPFITADYSIMRDCMEDFLLGVQALRKVAQAPEAVIAIKKTHKDLIQKLEKAIANVSGISICQVDDVYPMGWERTLIQAVTKKQYDKLPIEAGVVVNNVTTAYSFAKALTKGQPPVEMTLTVSGNAVKNPQNVRCPIGVSAKEVIEACGGYLEEEVKLIAGGPMMGKTIVNDAFVIHALTNALTILKVEKFNSVACMRCGMCSDHCPVGLQPVRIVQSMKANNKAMIEKLCASECVECGLCTYVCPSRLDVTENVKKAKRQLALQKR